jgi:serine/threonine protein kinase
VEQVVSRAGVHAVRLFHPDVLLESVLQMQDDILGTGHSGAVQLALDGNGHKYAVKTFDKQSLCWEAVHKEVSILSSLDHPHIIRLQHIFESEDSVQLVTEHMAGGELYTRIERGSMPEQEVASIAFQLLQAVSYMHSRKIVHRDLKLENILCKDELSNIVKVIDFGLATYWDGVTGLNIRCGTPYYFAPEMWTGSYKDKIDIWATGLVVYEMLTGHAAFTGDDEIRYMQQVRAGTVYYGSTFRKLSAEAQDFIRCLLTVDPDQRPSAVEALQHPWLQSFAQSIPDLDRLCSQGCFGESPDDKYACVKSVLAGLSAWELAELREQCNAMDQDRSGHISIADFCKAMRCSLELESHELEAIFAGLTATQMKEVSVDEVLAVASRSPLAGQELPSLAACYHVAQDQDKQAALRSSCHSVESLSTDASSRMRHISSEADWANASSRERSAVISPVSSTTFFSNVGAPRPADAAAGCTTPCWAWFSKPWLSV